MNATRNRRHETPSYWEEAYTAPRELVEEYPLSSTLIAFGVGVGVGVLIGQSLTGSLAHRGETDSLSMEKLGRQVCNALRSSLPESISSYLPR